MNWKRAIGDARHGEVKHGVLPFSVDIVELNLILALEGESRYNPFFEGGAVLFSYDYSV